MQTDAYVSLALGEARSGFRGCANYLARVRNHKVRARISSRNYIYRTAVHLEWSRPRPLTQDLVFATGATIALDQ